MHQRSSLPRVSKTQMPHSLMQESFRASREVFRMYDVQPLVLVSAEFPSMLLVVSQMAFSKYIPHVQHEISVQEDPEQFEVLVQHSRTCYHPRPFEESISFHHLQALEIVENQILWYDLEVMIMQLRAAHRTLLHRSYPVPHYLCVCVCVSVCDVRASACG